LAFLSISCASAIGNEIVLRVTDCMVVMF
jgi:hypothetical protein